MFAFNDSEHAAITAAAPLLLMMMVMMTISLWMII